MRGNHIKFKGDKKMKKIILVLLVMIFTIQTVQALACVGISQGHDWNRVIIEPDRESYFSPRVYNTTTAEDGECQDAWYHMELDFLTLDENIGDYFEYEFDNERFYLKGGETKQVLLKIKPKIEYGKYNLKITTIREAGASTMMSYVFTSSAKLTVSVGEETTGEYDEVPFWKVRKDCEGGFVVRQGEICPKLCPDGTIVLVTEKCPVEETKEVIFEEKITEDEGFLEEIFMGGGIAIIFVLGLIGFKFFGRKKEQSTFGDYEAQEFNY